jgi:hypothetical protein
MAIPFPKEYRGWRRKQSHSTGGWQPICYFISFNYGSAQTVMRGSPQTINGRKQAAANSIAKTQIDSSARVARTDDD